MEYPTNLRKAQWSSDFERVLDALTYISHPIRVSFVSYSITANTIREKHCTAYKCLLPLFHRIHISKYVPKRMEHQAGKKARHFV
jgi:hypothetical protein